MSVEALRTTALISIEEARRYVWRDEDDSSRDGILVDAINDVSESIADHLRREICPRVENTARRFDYDGSGFLDLAPYDLRTIDEIKLYTDRPSASQQTLTATNYRLWPTGGARGGTYLGVLLPSPAIEEFDYGFGWEVTITGDWGMCASHVTVPGALKLACKQWVENIVKNPGSYASHAMSGYTVTPEQDFARRAGMPPSVMYRLERWSRETRRALDVVQFRSGSQLPAVPHRLPTV
jgi:hypothetical protein